MAKMRTWFLGALAVLWLLPAAIGAEQRIAVADVERIFREYYKSKIAEDVIRQQSEVYRAYLLKLKDELKKLEDALAVARDGAQNIALSDAERGAFEITVRRKGEELAIKRAEAEKYAVDKNKQMIKLELDKRAEVLDDIRAEVKRRAAAEGYDFVLDISGRTSNDISMVVYFNPAADLTAELIKSLNATAVGVNEKK